jgi:fluoride exporter
MNLIGALAVFLGGGIGSLLRFGMSQLFKIFSSSTLPYATLSSNILSTALLGWIFYKVSPATHQTLYLFLAIGLCGGFSTFSTFSLETFQMLKNGQTAWAIANVAVSVVACITILFLISKSLK